MTIYKSARKFEDFVTDTGTFRYQYWNTRRSNCGAWAIPRFAQGAEGQLTMETARRWPFQ
jgi:hypothetical protein